MTPDPAARTLGRLDAITGLRWWAAFAVFLFHINNLVPLPLPIAEIAKFGYLGVAFFFVLSGFVLTWSWRPEVDKRTFYWRRFSRVYPLHVVTLLLAIPVFYSFAPDPEQTWVKPFDIALLVLCLFLLQGWSRDPVILFAGNPASWTLTAEAFFYALHPFITLVVRRLTLVGALAAAGGVVAFAFATRGWIALDPGGMVGALPWPVLRLNEFVLGMCLAWAFRKGWLPRIPLIVPVALIGAWLVTLAILPDRPETLAAYGAVAPYTNEIATALCALLIVSVASLDMRGRSRIMSSRPLVALGEWSFAFYLIHATFIYVARDLFGRQPGGWTGLLWVAGMLALSIVAAWALHVLVEAPVERRLRRWQNRRRDERTVAAAADERRQDDVSPAGF
ncbi:acyltransferase [Microbacterium sp. CFH 31415]|uniref:acyltransferase family protein n=1 Tax=Microbacterium sp. CFH 31415 TaxID=2921732 RepID=UPI001F139A5D|nr:acyltransferase [Microbacterium sp. CFH 31415]MCH6231346.1 acyltransferase [Microbacterium sp. CFH 31415]